MQKRDKNYIESVTCYGKVIMHFVSIIKGKILCFMWTQGHLIIILISV